MLVAKVMFASAATFGWLLLLARGRATFVSIVLLDLNSICRKCRYGKRFGIARDRDPPNRGVSRLNPYLYSRGLRANRYGHRTFITKDKSGKWKNDGCYSNCHTPLRDGCRVGVVDGRRLSVVELSQDIVQHLQRPPDVLVAANEEVPGSCCSRHHLARSVLVFFGRPSWLIRFSSTCLSASHRYFSWVCRWRSIVLYVPQPPTRMLDVSGLRIHVPVRAD